MKKVMLIAAIAGLCITSCKKVRTCECVTVTTTTVNGSTTRGEPKTNTGSTEKLTKSEARAKCEGNTGIITSGSGANSTTVDTQCTLKN